MAVDLNKIYNKLIEESTSDDEIKFIDELWYNLSRDYFIDEVVEAMRQLYMSKYNCNPIVSVDWQLDAPAAIDVETSKIFYNPLRTALMVVEGFKVYKKMNLKSSSAPMLMKLISQYLVIHEMGHKDFSVSNNEIKTLLEQNSKKNYWSELLLFLVNILEDSKIDTKTFAVCSNEYVKNILVTGNECFRCLEINEILSQLKKSKFSIRGHLMFLLAYRFAGAKKHELVLKAKQEQGFILTDEVFKLFDSIMLEDDDFKRAKGEVLEFYPLIKSIFTEKVKQDLKDKGLKSNASVLDAQKILEPESQENQEQEEKDSESNDSQDQSESDSQSNSSDSKDSSSSTSDDSVESSDDCSNEKEEGKEEEKINNSDSTSSEQSKESFDNCQDNNSSDNKQNDSCESSKSLNNDGVPTPNQSQDSGDCEPHDLTDEELEALADGVLNNIARELNKQEGTTEQRSHDADLDHQKCQQAEQYNKIVELNGFYNVNGDHVSDSAVTVEQNNLYNEYYNALNNAYNVQPETLSGLTEGEFCEDLIADLIFDKSIKVFEKTIDESFNKNVNINFMIDKSGSMHSDGRAEAIKSFLPMLVHAVVNVGMKAQVIAFDDVSYIVKKFDEDINFDYSNSKLVGAINKVYSSGGCTDMREGLKYLIEDDSISSDDDTINLVVIATDGCCEGQEETKKMIEMLINKNYIVYPVSIDFDKIMQDYMSEIFGSVHNYSSDNLVSLGKDLTDIIINKAKGGN
jgi:hypothetical protein